MRQFYGRLEKCVLSAEKTMSIKIPRFRGGIWALGGGGECRFYFYGRTDFSERALLRSGLLHDPLGVHPMETCRGGGWGGKCCDLREGSFTHIRVGT